MEIVKTENKNKQILFENKKLKSWLNGKTHGKQRSKNIVKSQDYRNYFQFYGMRKSKDSDLKFNGNCHI